MISVVATLAGVLAVASEASGAASPPEDKTCVIVVVGAPGTPDYGADFARAARRWEEEARRGGAEVLRLGPAEGATADGGPSDRDRLEEAIRREARTSGESLWIVLIGHGTFDGRAAKFNLRGPDVSASDLAEWLEGCERPVAIINCASASAPFINRLSGDSRVVVTATKSGYEYNYARFGTYLARAISKDALDIDKDGQVSLLEAFLAAASRTEEFYEEEVRLATEHALIDDNGDGLGTPADWFRGARAVRRARDDAEPDGVRANQFILVPGAEESKLPADRRARRDELELAISRLRAKKPELDEDAFYAELEEILLELARLYEEGEPASDEAE